MAVEIDTGAALRGMNDLRRLVEAVVGTPWARMSAFSDANSSSDKRGNKWCDLVNHGDFDRTSFRILRYRHTQWLDTHTE